MSTVLVTGGSGFLGAHCIAAALAGGYSVRTTVRNLSREPAVRAMLSQAGQTPGDRLTFHAADLMRDDNWNAAAAGCDYVLHVASPFPMEVPKDENELIVPAREGTLRVLRAARAANVKRVVLTSSFAAVGYGHPPRTTPFTETDWSNVNAPLAPYIKSKTLAERAAWDYVQNEGHGLDLAVVNPVGIFGPVLGPDFATSIEIVKRLLDGSVPGVPRMCFATVDVRDVADLHLRAMTNPAASGQRFLAVAGDPIWLRDVAKLLKSRLGDAAKKVPTRDLPNFVMSLAGVFNRTAKMAASELDNVRYVSNEKAKNVLAWTPRSNEEAVLASAESLIKLGLVKNR